MENKDSSTNNSAPSLFSSDNENSGPSGRDDGLLTRLQQEQSGKQKPAKSGTGGGLLAGLLGLGFVLAIGALTWLNADDISRLLDGEPEAETVNNNRQTPETRPKPADHQSATVATRPRDAAPNRDSQDRPQEASLQPKNEQAQSAAIITSPQPNPLDVLQETPPKKPQTTASASPPNNAGSERAKTETSQEKPKVAKTRPKQPTTAAAAAASAPPAPETTKPEVDEALAKARTTLEPPPKREKAPLKSAVAPELQEQADVELLEALVEHLNQRPAAR